MNVSLEELYNLRCPPETRQPLDDIEDMTFSRLRLATDAPWLAFQGQEVTITSVEKDEDDKFTGRHTFSPDSDDVLERRNLIARNNQCIYQLSEEA
jgi:hypothetical protein